MSGSTSGLGQQRETNSDGDQPDAPQPRVLIVTDNASERMGGEAVLPLEYFRVALAAGSTPGCWRTSGTGRSWRPCCRRSSTG